MCSVNSLGQNKQLFISQEYSFYRLLWFKVQKQDLVLRFDKILLKYIDSPSWDYTSTSLLAFHFMGHVIGCHHQLCSLMLTGGVWQSLHPGAEQTYHSVGLLPVAVAIRAEGTELGHKKGTVMEGLFGLIRTSHLSSHPSPGIQGLQRSLHNMNLGALMGRHSIPSGKGLQS